MLQLILYNMQELFSSLHWEEMFTKDWDTKHFNCWKYHCSTSVSYYNPYLCELHYNLICVSYITIIILLDLQNTSQIMPPTSVLYQENHVFDSAFIQKCTASLKSSSYPNLHPMSVLLEFKHIITNHWEPGQGCMGGAEDLKSKFLNGVMSCSSRVMKKNIRQSSVIA